MKKNILYLIILNFIIMNSCEVEKVPSNNIPTPPILSSPKNKEVGIKLNAVLNWNASLDIDGDALKYNVYFGTVNPPTIKVKDLQIENTYTPSLKEKTTYYWKIEVNDGKGGVASSDVWSFTTVANIPNPTNSAPSIPVIISPLANASGVKLNSTLEWQSSTDPDGDVVKYYVVFSTDYPPDDTVSRLQTTTTYTPALTQSTPYYWKIIATDEKGGFNESETITFTTTSNNNVNGNPPSIPNLLNPSNGAANISLNVVLSWNKSIDPEGDIVTYSVLFGTDATPTTSVSSAKSDTLFAPSLVSNTLYYWKIIATDASGLTSESDISSFTTLAQNSTKITLNSPAHNSTKVKLNEILKWNEWKPANGGTFKYTVYLGTESTPTTQVSIEQTGITFAPSLTASTSYYWKVIATDGSANTSESDVWKFTTASNPPPKPTLTSPANQSTNIALNTSLNWNAVTDGNKTIKYNVYFGTSSQLTKIESTLQTANSFTPTGIKGNTTYYWKIVADNGDGGISESDIWSFTTLNSPPVKPVLNTPADLTANVSISEALKWSSSTDPDGDIVNYNVYLGTANPPTTKVTNTLQSSTSFNPPLSGNTKYYWKVTAEDGKGGVTESDVRSFTTGAVPVSTPVLISPNNNALNIPLTPVPTLSWNASVGTNGGAVTYNVYFGTTNTPSKVTSTPQTATTYTPTINFLSNVQYYWKIEALIANEGNFNSEIRQFKTEIVPPSKPVLSTPTNGATNISLTTSLSWTASTSSSGYSINYKVYLGTSSNPSTVVSNSQTANSYIPSVALLSNTTYYWKIEANDGNGGVAVSEISNFKTIVPPSVPILTSPADMANDISINSNLTWTASTTPSSNDIKYKVLLDTSSTFSSSVKVESNLQTGTTYTLTNLLSNINYYWKVISVDGNGLMTESEVRKFKSLLIPPSKPTLSAPTNNATNISLTPRLSWTASTSSSGYSINYKVYLSTSTNPLTVVINSQTENSYTPTTALLSNTTYYWKIEANDGNGGVAVSEISNFKTLPPPSVPVLTSPSNNTTNVSLTTNLTWSASTSTSGETIKYNVYFGTVNPPTLKVSSLQAGTSYTPTLSVNTTYYWKIEADDGNGGVSVSEVRNFTTLPSEFTSDGFTFISVESGTFTMGCTSEQGADCGDSEKPAHSVTLSAYSIGKYEVTQAQWVSVMGSNPSYFQSSNGQTACNDCPVEQVSWDDIQTFLTTLNTKTGKSYRLPTEAEWEYAARGGKKSSGYKYSGSNEVGSVAWYSANSNGKTHSIGTKSANELGIYDMSGNVWEWCSDRYSLSYNTSESVTNPTGPSTGTYRVLRGGYWSSNTSPVRVSGRGGDFPSGREYYYGFRIILP